MNGHARAVISIWLMPSLVWIALMMLLTLTVTAAYLPLHSFKTPIAMTIAASKAALIMIFFMNLRSSRALVRLAAVAGLMWLILMFALTGADYLTRY
jgi:cytochrome c oxidase subunit 4